MTALCSRRCTRFLLLPILTGFASVPVAAQGFTLDPALRVANAADADQSGAVDAEEWRQFLASLDIDEEGVVDRQQLLVRVMSLDADGDGVLTIQDVEQVLSADRSELSNGGGGMLRAISTLLADVDGNGEVDEPERRTFVESARQAEGEQVADETVSDWLQRAAAIPPENDPNAMSPGVIVMTIDSSLDIDASGRVTNADLERLRLTLDANSDGDIAADEFESYRRMLATAGATAAQERWTIDEDAASRPPLIDWQRSLEDALFLSRSTGKPLLLCVNTDGESASESLAWGRYRNEDFAALSRGFIPLIASPDVHATAQHDDRGRRLPDPRFGRVVDSEHIDIEPLLYERYFEGRRVAPRHVGVSPEGEVLFDAFLLQDLSVVDAKLEEFGNFDTSLPEASELSEEQLENSPDAGHRAAYEARFLAYDGGGRANLAARSLSTKRTTQHPEVLRMSLYDPVPAVREAGLRAITQAPEHLPLELAPRALYVADEEQRTELERALRLAADKTDDVERRAALLRKVRFAAACDARSEAVDLERWRIGFALAPAVAETSLSTDDLDNTTALLDTIDATLEESPGDMGLLLERAAAFERLARTKIALGQDPSFFLEDVLAACEAALAVHSHEGRALGLQAWAHYMLSDMGPAGDSAAHAMSHMVREAATPLAHEVARILAQARSSVLYDAMAADEEWPRGTIADAIAGHEALLAHPASGEAEWIAYLQLLGAVDAYRKQHEAVRRALRRLPTSAELHNWLRWVEVRDGGAPALEAAYEEEFFQEVRPEDRPAIDWFRGLASFVAAERDVACGQMDTALERYARSRAWFEQSVEAREDFRASAAYYECLGLAAEARVLAKAQRWQAAVDSLVAAYSLTSADVSAKDGLDKSPEDSARELRRALTKADQSELAEQLQLRLDQAKAAREEVPAPADEPIEGPALEPAGSADSGE